MSEPSTVAAERQVLVLDVDHKRDAYRT